MKTTRAAKGGLLMRAAVWSCAALAASCATTASTGQGASNSQIVATPSQEVSAAGERKGISGRAKLLFEEAVAAFESQKKARVFDFPALEKKFLAALEMDPNLAEASFNLGVLAERQGKSKEAMARYQEALAKKPGLRQAAESLGVMAQNAGDEARAVAIYQELQSAYPDDASSRARLAEVHRRRGELDQAIELARQALFRDPRALSAYKTMMQVYFQQKQYSLARLIALRALKIDGADPELYYFAGLLSLAEKDPARAKVNFKKCVEVGPEFLPVRYELANLAISEQNYLAAELHLRKILQADGRNLQALVNLAVAYKGMGQLDKAMATYDEVQAINSEAPELLLNRGTIVALKGEPEKALSLFRAYVARKGEAGLNASHPVHRLIEEQEAFIKQREENKQIAIEAQKVEEEMKRQEAAEAERVRQQKEEELRRQQDEAKGIAPVAAPPKDQNEDKAPEAKNGPVDAAVPQEEPSSGGLGDEPRDVK